MITQTSVTIFLISSMVWNLFNQLQVFWNVSDRIARVFHMSGATEAVALVVSKAFDRIWYTDLLQKLNSYRSSGQIFGLISPFPSNRRLRVILDGNSWQKYPVNAGVPQGSILGRTLPQRYINDDTDDFICDTAMYANGTTLYFKCDQASDRSRPDWHFLFFVLLKDFYIIHDHIDVSCFFFWVRKT